MAKKTNDEGLVKTENEAVNLRNSAVPAHLQQYAEMGGLGLEQATQDDFVMPRLAIAQGLSPQVTKGDPLYIKGLETGMFFNTLTQEIYGEGPIIVTPLYMFKTRIFFPPRGTEAPPLCSANKVDEEGRLVGGRITPEGCDICPHSQFLTTPRPDGSTNPDCTLFYNYIVLIHKKSEGVLEPVSFSLKSKMIKPAKKWNTMMRIRQMPTFTMNYSLVPVAEKAPKGTFFNVKIDNAGDVDSVMIKETAKLFQQWRNKPVNIDIRGEERNNFDAAAEENGEM